MLRGIHENTMFLLHSLIHEAVIESPFLLSQFLKSTYIISGLCLSAKSLGHFFPVFLFRGAFFASLRYLSISCRLSCQYTAQPETVLSIIMCLKYIFFFLIILSHVAPLTKYKVAPLGIVPLTFALAVRATGVSFSTLKRLSLFSFC